MNNAFYWSPEEEELLLKRLVMYGMNWVKITEGLPGRTSTATAAKYHDMKSKEQKIASMIASMVARGLLTVEEQAVLAETLKNRAAWAPDEDDTLLRGYADHGGAFDRIALDLPGRGGGACRSRYYQIPAEKRAARIAELMAKVGEKRPSVSEQAPKSGDSSPGIWSTPDDKLLSQRCAEYARHNNKWEIIAEALPQQTAITCENRFKVLEAQNLRIEGDLADEAGTALGSPQLRIENVVAELETSDTIAQDPSEEAAPHETTSRSLADSNDSGPRSAATWRPWESPSANSPPAQPRPSNAQRKRPWEQ